jgi:hypothetical protein
METDTPFTEFLCRAFLHRLAALVNASEAVAFAVHAPEPSRRRLELLTHIRPGGSMSEIRESAVHAFENMVLKCLAENRDGAIPVSVAAADGSAQYCLVTRMLDSDVVRAVIAVIVRCLDQEEARRRLRTLGGTGFVSGSI